MSIMARIRAHGGDIIRTEWRFALKRGRLSPEALAWLRKHWAEACLEAWPLLGAWQERAAIREFDGGQERDAAEREAYAEIAAC